MGEVPLPIKLVSGPELRMLRHYATHWADQFKTIKVAHGRSCRGKGKQPTARGCDELTKPSYTIEGRHEMACDTPPCLGGKSRKVHILINLATCSHLRVAIDCHQLQ